jgi:hypothetical protein
MGRWYYYGSQVNRMLGVDSIYVVRDRDCWRPVVNTVMNFRVPYVLAGRTLSLSRRTLLREVSQSVMLLD